MEDWKEELLDKAQQIKTETQEGANTNVRVGGLFEEVINRLGEGVLKEPISSMNGNVAGTMMANTVVARNDRNTGWEYKVLKDGSTENSVLVDLTNEMDAVGLDRDLNAEFRTELRTTITAHYGSTHPEITGIEYYCSNPNIEVSPVLDSTGYTGEVRVVIPKGTVFGGETIQVTLTAVCAQGRGSADFTIVGIKQGTDGQSAVIYQLLPSVSAVKRDSSNVYTTTKISCDIQKRIGLGGASIVSPVFPDPSDPTKQTLYIQYSIDGGSYVDYTGEINFMDLNNPPVDNISFVLLQYNEDLRRAITIDKETVPVILDGLNGTSPFIVDIDNEMAAIPVNESGYVVTDKQLPVNINAFFGAQDITEECVAEVTDAIRAALPDNFVITTSGMDVLVEILHSETVVMPEVIDVEITVTSENYGSRNVTFTICTVKSGGQGEDAEIYQLKPNYSAMPFFINENGELVGEYTFECQIQKTTGSSVEIFDLGSVENPNVLSNYAVYYQFTKNTYYPYPEIPAQLTGPLHITADEQDDYTVQKYNRLELELWRLDEQGEKKIKLDKETIPILKDGKKGDKGEDAVYYDIDDGGINSLVKHLDGSYTPSAISATGRLHIGNEVKNAVKELNNVALYASYGTMEITSNSDYIDKSSLSDSLTVSLSKADNKKYIYLQLVYYTVNQSGGRVFTKLASKQIPVVEEIQGPEGKSIYVADLDNKMDGVCINDAGRVAFAQSVSTGVSLHYRSTTKAFTIITVLRNNSQIDLGREYNGVKASYNSSSKIFTVSYAQGAQVSGEKDDFAITLQSNEDGSIQRTVHFTVIATVGAIYNLLPSVKEIHASIVNDTYVVDKSTKSTTYNLRCGYTKRSPNGVTKEDDWTSVIDGVYYIYFRIHTRGGSWSNWMVYNSTNKSNINSLNVNTYDIVDFALCTSITNNVISGLQDTEDIYVLADGKDGKDAIRVDLDNEHEDFIYNDAGERISNQVITQARLYDGTTQITDTAAVVWKITDVDGDSSWGTSTSTNVTASIATSGLITINGIQLNTAKLRVRASYKSNYYYAAFTANRTKGDKYDLIFVPDVISYNPNSPSGSSISISAKRMDMQGNIVNIDFGSYNDRSKISTTLSHGYLRLFFCYMDGDSKGDFYQVIQSLFNIDDSDAGAYTGVYFELRKYETYYAIDYSIADYETVPIVKDGKNGESTPGQRGKTGRFYYYAQKWSDSSTVSYLVSDAQAPYFSYEGEYWLFNPDDNGTYTMHQMGSPGEGKSSWIKMTSDFKYIITEAIFGKYAHLGSFIINEDWMLSQYGELVPPAGQSVITVNASNVNTKYSGNAPVVLNGNYTGNGVIVYKVSFNVSSTTTITIELTTSSESGWDFGAVGIKDDDSLLSATASSISSDTGSVTSLKTSGSNTVSTSISLSAGSHYLYIGYFKDGSQNVGNDNASFSISGATYDLTEAKKTSGMSMSGGSKSVVPYGWFDPTDPEVKTLPASGYKFRPAFAVDGLTGETYQQNAHIKGNITATGGSITGNLDVTGGLNIKSGSTTKLQINGLTASAGDNNGDVTIIDTSGIYVKRDDVGFKLTKNGFQRWNPIAGTNGAWVNFYGGRYVHKITFSSLYTISINEDFLVINSTSTADDNPKVYLPIYGLFSGKVFSILNIGRAFDIYGYTNKIKGDVEYDHVTLNRGDRMEFVYDKDNTIWYVNYMSFVHQD